MWFVTVVFWILLQHQSLVCCTYWLIMTAMEQNKRAKKINIFLECAFYPQATTAAVETPPQMPPLPMFSLGFQAASPSRSLLLNLLVLCWSARHAARALSSLFVLLSSQIIAASSTWALCPPQAGQRSSHHPLVRLPPASVLPLACFPVAIEACHVSAGSCWSALVFNKSSYVCEGRVEGTDNNNHYYSSSKGYLAFTGALTDRSLTRSRGQVLCLWQEKGLTLETGEGFIYKGQKKNPLRVQT